MGIQLIAGILATAIIVPQPTLLDELWDYLTGDTDMAARLPVFASGDVTYSTGNPVYDGGADLTTGTNAANYCGDTDVARFILAATGVRMAIWSDSQFSGAVGRGSQGIASTWEYTWSAWPIIAGPTDPGQSQANSGIVDAQKFQGTNYTDGTATATTSPSTLTIDAFLAAEGIDDPSEIPGRMALFAQTASPTGYFEALGVRDANDPTDNEWWYDDTNWDHPDGVKIEITMSLIAGGTTTMATAGRYDFQHYNSGGSLVTSNEAIADITAVLSSQKATLSADNDNAVLVYYKGPTVESFSSSSGTRPQAFIRSQASPYTSQRKISLGGLIRRKDGKGDYEDNISLCFVNDAASMNPSNWIHGAAISGQATRNTNGSKWDIRQVKNANLGNPNLLFFSFGHNSPIRSGTGFKAASTYQADFFDLVWQAVNDYQQQNAAYPMVVIHIPWYGGFMDDTRHDEMVGIVNALNALGVKTLGVDSYNYWGGSGFANGTVTDYETATQFTLDGVPGTGVHPNSADDARAAWYGVKRMIEEASLDMGGNRVRDRSRER